MFNHFLDYKPGDKIMYQLKMVLSNKQANFEVISEQPFEKERAWEFQKARGYDPKEYGFHSYSSIPNKEDMFVTRWRCDLKEEV